MTHELQPSEPIEETTQKREVDPYRAYRELERMLFYRPSQPMIQREMGRAAFEIVYKSDGDIEYIRLDEDGNPTAESE